MCNLCTCLTLAGRTILKLAQEYRKLICTAENGWNLDSSIFFEKRQRITSASSSCVILSGMLGGVVITMFHLRLLFSLDIEHALRVIIIDALTILALLEIFKTTMAYFSEGRIKVTYIIDTVIVVMLTEIMACWFKEFDLYKLGTIAVLVLVLCVMRVFSVKYSPGIKHP
ncbi:phosphate-starvation-inducible PsiE family protein [Candidatus Kuenenia stuttgartensis]|uniref:phosphate-starvation-inducible PsiE family protein n=1 Tax=Kuenenia stuttgartiensis TaxID=174633 RepID=UPI001E618FE0|nr:phosphate-starvation-inducible PsiE family protein [Candidatus Kuenenia stuttgartiensis]